MYERAVTFPKSMTSIGVDHVVKRLTRPSMIWMCVLLHTFWARSSALGRQFPVHDLPTKRLVKTKVRPEGFEPSTLGSEGNQKRKEKSLFSQGIYRFLAILPMSES